MPKGIIFFLFLGSFFSLYGNKIEILANHIDSNGTTIHAQKNVLISYNHTLLKASNVLFDSNRSILTLWDNIEAIGFDGSKQQSDFMQIDTKKEAVSFRKLFLMSANDIWIFSKSAKKKNNHYSLESSFFSSCDVKEPIWKMGFSHATYDTNLSYLKLYDTKLYMWGRAIFYTPYLGFSPTKSRSSGLLFPTLGYSQLEGLLYEQPLYFALNKSVDIELNPQIRTERSEGIYGTVRFVGSAYSKGTIRTGFFKDIQSYKFTETLSHNKHYGFEMNYKSSAFLSQLMKDDDFTDGLYINSTFLNDIDYLNLQKNGLSHFGLTPLQESRVNYFGYTNDYYLGINSKYFIDTRKQNNEETLQILPSIQLHKYLTHFLWKNLTYMVNVNVNNFTREKGITFKERALNIPIEWTKGFFDNLVTLSLKEEMFYDKFLFDNGEVRYENYEYFSTLHKVNIFSDLTKKYDNFMHILQPSLLYVKAGTQKQTPVSFSNLSQEQQALFSIGLPEDRYLLSLNQYLYDKESIVKFYQRLYQEYYPNRVFKWANINSEIKYNFSTHIMLYHHLIYSHQFHKLRESSILINLNSDLYHVNLGYTYSKALEDSTKIVDANDILLSFDYDITQRVKMNVGLVHSFSDSRSQQWNVGLNYNRNCWGVGFSLREEITPRPNGFTRDSSFYIHLKFVPFGTIGTGEFEE